MVTLKRLQGLYLFENRLEGNYFIHCIISLMCLLPPDTLGKIPDELSDLPDLLGIYLFNNNFEGTVISWMLHMFFSNFIPMIDMLY